MRRRWSPLPLLAGEQAEAADPRVHAALSASAGTGKTQVLTARVLRLLLGGVRPDAILCLTFTKAGAAEMANRIGRRLADWVRLPDPALKKELFALGEPTDPLNLVRARRLFARVLDAPGGLRIQTIHSFAHALLASFPAEADVPPGLTPLDGRAEQELARRTLADLLADAERNRQSGLIADVQRLSLRLGEGDAIGYLMLCARRRDALADFGPGEGMEARLRAAMDLPAGSVEDLLAERCGDGAFDCDLLGAIAEANRRWGTATGAKTVETVERWLALDPAQRAAALPDLALIVFTGSGEMRKVSSGLRGADPDYEERAARLGQSVAELMRLQTGARLAADMAAGLRAGAAFAEAYARAKRSAGVADFDDLIGWTRALLSQPGIGEWVRYKLDRRTDHILVDEAQDTNRAQWDIVEALAGDFFSGASESEERHRTLFMVGDFKQAIFRFQGTDPREFEAARRWASGNAAALVEAQREDHEARRAALEFKDLSIEASFRSAPAVLEAVDATIAIVGHRAMGLPEEPRLHRAHHAARPGSVELWAPFTAPDGEAGGEEGWLDADERAYATMLAGRIRQWLDEAPVLASTKRPLSAGDILVLVRSRGELASLIVARLFAAGVAVAGIDRLHLSRPLAVRDLLAAVGFAVQPLDDLNLACLLVSPLIGWSQEQLYECAFGRGGLPLWETLKRRDDLAETRAALQALLDKADFDTPHRFLETILSGPLDGRRKLFGRLGVAARDPIDELLASALDFARQETPSLDRFLAWFGRGDVEIQRDPSAPADAVRVMTVHGAKGLEAPVVIVADATADPAKIGGVARSIDFSEGEDRAPVPLVRPRKAELVEPFARQMADEEARSLEEHWRLLYVAMTRASERLVIAGIAKQAVAENSWHSRVGAALASLGAAQDDQALRYSGKIAPSAVRAKASRRPVDSPVVPDWARRTAPVEARPPRPLAPSAMAEDRDSALPPSPAQRAAALRGTLIHALLERLPEVPPADRRATALRWLAQPGRLDDPVAREEVADLVCALLDDARFGSLFGAGSLAEAPFAATLPDGRVIAGTVDRLLVEDGQVSVIDYKTGRAPAPGEPVPAAHRAQMDAYSEALAVIFPGRAVRAALLYTAGPQLVALDG